MTNIEGFEKINEIRDMASRVDAISDYDFLGFDKSGIPIVNLRDYKGWALPDFYIRAKIDDVRIKATFSVGEGGYEHYVKTDGNRAWKGNVPPLRTSQPNAEKLCGWVHRIIKISCENGNLTASKIKDLCQKLLEDVTNFSFVCMISDRTEEQNAHFGIRVDRENTVYWNCYNMERFGYDFKDGEKATECMGWESDEWVLVVGDDNFYEIRNESTFTNDELHLRQIHKEIKDMNMPIPLEQLVAAEEGNHEFERLKRVAVVKNFLVKNKDIVLYNGKKVSEWCKIDDYYGTTVFMTRGYPNCSENEKNWFHGEDWGVWNFEECDTEEALNIAKQKMTLTDETKMKVIFNELLSLIEKLGVSNYITRCDMDRYEIDLTSKYDDCLIGLFWDDDKNVNVSYTPMFTSINGEWSKGKCYSNTENVQDVKNRIAEWAENLKNPVSESKFMLLIAIRERDEKIAKELALKKAKEEAELAKKKAEEERIRLENEKNLQEFELIKKFVDEIGDFEVEVPSKEGDGNFTYMPIRQVIDFEDDLTVKFNYHMNFDCDDSTSFSIKKHTYDEAKNIIIEWAVHYGARKPETMTV